MPQGSAVRILVSMVAATLVLLRMNNYAPTNPVLASPPPDAACKGCHSNLNAELEFPSGEKVSLLISPAELSASPHHTAADEAVSCTACHRGVARYQYPHQPNPAQTHRDFVMEISDNCTRCHLNHKPLHDTDRANAALPVCADCHGSHQIEFAQNIPQAMPANCLNCHPDQTEVWAVDLIPFRAGFGEAADGYIGSDTCGGCHQEKYNSWGETLHARLILNPADDPAAVIGDFASDDSDLTFGLDDVHYTIGSRWKQQYLTQNEAGDFHLLPAQWNVESGEWVALNADGDAQADWRRECGSCHVTGLDTQGWGFAEFGIGCESCHGPGAAHAADPRTVKPYAVIDNQVCGACHSRGTSPDGFPFPATYRPGDTLADHFTFTVDESALWPDGSAGMNHQQYTDWQLGSKMSLFTTCVTCHTVHDSGAGQSQLKMPLNDLCLQCHTDKKRVIEHTPFHDLPAAISGYEFLCSDCHMPKTATGTTANDIRNHSFLQPNPQGSIDHGGIENMPNACNTCHTDLGETPQWATETIAFAVKTSDPKSAAALKPGPTPTSPPPPTAIPSVGQIADAEAYQVEGSRWARNIFYPLMGFIIIGAGFGVYTYIRSRRVTHG